MAEESFYSELEKRERLRKQREFEDGIDIRLRELQAEKNPDPDTLTFYTFMKQALGIRSVTVDMLSDLQRDMKATKAYVESLHTVKRMESRGRPIAESMLDEGVKKANGGADRDLLEMEHKYKLWEKGIDKMGGPIAAAIKIAIIAFIAGVFILLGVDPALLVQIFGRG